MNAIVKQSDVVSIKEYDIDILEKTMLEMPQVDCPLKHIFGEGLYIRELRIPAGAIAVGHYQKTAHMNIMLRGRVLMLNPDGSRTELDARKEPITFVGAPGRKVGYILDDVIWQNVYSTDETDIEKLEETYVDKSEEWKKNNLLINQMEKLEGDICQ